MDPAIDSIFPFENHKYRPWLFKDSQRIRNIIKTGGYDLIIDFTALPLTVGVCAKEANTPSIGFKRFLNLSNGQIDLGLGYNLSFSYSDTDAIRDLMLRLVSPWNEELNAKSQPRLFFSRKTIEKARDLLTQSRVGNEKYIVFHPGAKWKPKRWPIRCWRALIEMAKDDSKYKIIILGGKDDIESVQRIIYGLEKSDGVALICDQVDMASVIIREAVLCVCNDSAAMHIAAAVGTPSVTIFGPVSPSRSAPSNEEGCHVLYDDMFCSPCTLYYSRNRCRRGINFCMYAIKPRTVFRNIEQVLNTSAE